MDLLTPLLFSAPVWVVLLVGIVFAILTWKTHRTVSMLAVVALGGFLVLDVVGTVLWAAFEGLVGLRATNGWVRSVFFGVQTFVHAGFVGLAIVAAVRDREVVDGGE